MKVITTWPEWAWAILNLEKKVENRGWIPPSDVVGQDIAIHAGKNVGGRKGFQASVEGVSDVIFMARRAKWVCQYDGVMSGMFRKDRDAHVLEASKIDKGVIVGVATLKTVVRPREQRSVKDEIKSGWGDPNQYWWILDNVRTLERPIECRGYQKLWTVPADVEREVWENIG
jgi:hypothetical protein